MVAVSTTNEIEAEPTSERMDKLEQKPNSDSSSTAHVVANASGFKESLSNLKHHLERSLGDKEGVVDAETKEGSTEDCFLSFGTNSRGVR